MGLNIHCGCLDIFTFTKLRDVQSSYGKINCFFFFSLCEEDEGFDFLPGME